MQDDTPNYQSIAAHYESCFRLNGDTSKGVDWPNPEDAKVRYQVMLDLAAETKDDFTLLDFGCGAGHFLEFLEANSPMQSLKYTGLDISTLFTDHCRKKHPDHEWLTIDVHQKDLPQSYDFVIMNGVFTEKLSLSFEDMVAFWQNTLLKVFPYVKRGLAFNVMSTNVDWQREDLFHLPLDQMAAFVSSQLSRHFIVRKDYGLYEYTVYVFKSPKR